MEQISLDAEIRTGIGKRVSHARAEGYVPGVIYGSHYPATPIQVESRALHKALALAGGNVLIKLQLAGKDDVAVLAREVQRDTLKHNIMHVDFQQVVMTEKINAEVPVRLHGEAPAVRDLGAILVHSIDRLEVHCLPGDLPQAIDVDITVLAHIHDTITVANVQVPSEVAVLSDPDTVIARIEAPRVTEVEPEEEAEEVPAAGEPELVGRRPEGEEEEED